jgi:predicted RNase H-like HicB family nuclease
MNKELLEQARKLAIRNYDVLVESDELSDGTPIFMASNPELDGCKSQGKSIEQAIANLNEARVDYIYSLLEDGLSVPDPANLTTITGTFPDAVVTYTKEYLMELPDEFEDVLERVIQPTDRVPLYRVSLRI